MKNQIDILIVGGLQSEREFLQNILKKTTDTNYNATLTDSGIDGLAMIKSKKIQCILLDFCIFDMDGEEFVKRCLSQNKENMIPIVILSERSYNHSFSPYAKNPYVTALAKTKINLKTLNVSIQKAITCNKTMPAEKENVPTSIAPKVTMRKPDQISGIDSGRNNRRLLMRNYEKKVSDDESKIITHAFSNANYNDEIAEELPTIEVISESPLDAVAEDVSFTDDVVELSAAAEEVSNLVDFNEKVSPILEDEFSVSDEEIFVEEFSVDEVTALEEELIEEPQLIIIDDVYETEVTAQIEEPVEEETLEEEIILNATDEILLEDKFASTEASQDEYEVMEEEIMSVEMLNDKLEEDEYSLPELNASQDDILIEPALLENTDEVSQHAELISLLSPQTEINIQPKAERNDMLNEKTPSDTQAEYQSQDSIVTIEDLHKLPNHNRFKDMLTSAIAKAKRQQKLLALMVFDSEELENTRSQLGVDVYETLLAQIVTRFRNKLRVTDVISRMDALALGEIAILLDDFCEYLDVAYVAKRLIAELQEPFKIDEHEIKIYGCFGIACYPLDCKATLDFHKNAVIAMYHNRQPEVSNYYFFNDEITSVANRHECIAKDISNAFEKQEFYLHYQPIINLNTNELLATEAYIRWDHPNIDIIGPNEFMPIAERLGHSKEIGSWMLEVGASEFLQWKKADIAPERFHLKVTYAEVRDPDFVSKVLESLANSNITARQLGFEIPNTVIKLQHPVAINNLFALSDAGVYLCLENFATLSCCLHDLHRYPFNALSINRNYVRTCFEDRESMDIIKSIISVGKHMGFDVIAKGIENAKQLQFLQEHDCTFGQGYFICKPLATKELQIALQSKKKILLLSNKH